MLNAMGLALIKKLGGGGGSSGGGSGADLLNADGIIKQEVLPDGYPYAVEGVILPETTSVIDPESGQAVFTDIIDIVGGETYTVNWNGNNYKCVAVRDTMEGALVYWLGDTSPMTGGEATGEPFLAMVLSAEAASLMGVGVVAMALDGSTSVTLSIFGKTITKMNSQYIELPTLEVEPIVHGMMTVEPTDVATASRAINIAKGIGLARLVFNLEVSTDNVVPFETVMAAEIVEEDGLPSATFTGICYYGIKFISVAIQYAVKAGGAALVLDSRSF